MTIQETNRAALIAAIERSQSHTEIGTCDYVGSHIDLSMDLNVIQEDDHDSVMESEKYGPDGKRVIDAWGYLELGDSEMTWRINVTLTEE